MKKIGISLFALCLLFSTILNNGKAFASTAESGEKVVDEVVDIFSKEIKITEEGIFIDNQQVILDELQNVDLDAIEELAKSQGINYGFDLTPQKLFDIYMIGINELNKEIAEGEVKVLENGTLVESDDQDFYLQGGSTYDVHYWWGVKRYKSTANARKWAVDLRSAGHANAAGSLLGGVVFGGIGAVPNGLTAIYCYNLADRVDYHNGRTTRGIIANMHYTLTFTITTQ